jgi:YaeQ protein
VSAKFSFDLASEERRRALPPKIIVGQKENESARQVLLKFLGYILFFRERLQIEPRLPDDSIPFEPDVIQFDYSLRPVLWVECGDCGVSKLHKLAVKAPEAEIWVLKRSLSEAEGLHHAMAREGLRRDRYGLVGLDAAMFDEMLGLLAPRNKLTWFRGGFEPPQMQFEFNGLWFDAPFTVLKF